MLLVIILIIIINSLYYEKHLNETSKKNTLLPKINSDVTMF